MNVLETWLRAADPEAVAITDDIDSITYSDLLDRSAQLAQYYQSRYGTGGYLLLLANMTVDFAVALIAVSRSGNTPVPVDPASPERLIEAISNRCGGAHLASSDPIYGEILPNIAPFHADVALVLFTSGTSGVPKGVPVNWENLTHSVTTVSAYLDYAEFDSAAVVLPLHYSYALLTQLFCMFYVGGQSRLFKNFRNPIKFAKSVENEGLRTFCGVPSTYHALCAIHRISPLTMAGVRVLCSAGAAMDRSLMPEIREMFPEARFFDNYGMTEATPRISFLCDDDPRFDETTCGKPIDGLEVRIVDEQTNVQLRDGEQGIVAIRGPNVFSGYLNDSTSTRLAFTDDNFLLSGDYGYMRDGYIYITGRVDDVFNVGGEKVVPLEIERVLSEHPHIISSAIGKLEDEKRGTVSVAYLEIDGDIRRREIVEFLQDRLTPAKIPLRYLRVSSWPMTGNGKLQRSRLSPDNKAIVISEIE